MWKKLKQNELERSLHIIQNSANHYKNWKKEKIIDTINRKRGEMFYYENSDYNIVLGFSYIFTQKTWRVKYGAFEGNNSDIASKIIFDKIKDFMKRRGVENLVMHTAPFNLYSKQQEDMMNHLVNNNIEIVKLNISNGHILTVKLNGK